MCWLRWCSRHALPCFALFVLLGFRELQVGWWMGRYYVKKVQRLCHACMHVRASTPPHLTYLIRVDVAGLGQPIQLGPELARLALPRVLVLALQPVALLTQPVGVVRAGLGDEVDVEPVLLEHGVGVQRFGDKHAGLLVVLVERCVGRGDGD